MAGGRPSADWAASAPASGPMVSPVAPRPVAMTRPSRPGTGPSSGRMHPGSWPYTRTRRRRCPTRPRSAATDLRPHPSHAACIDGGLAFPRKRYSCGRWDRSGPGEWRPRSLRDRVAHMGGMRGAVDPGHLEVDVPVEPVEQPLACAEDHRSCRDDQLIDLPRRQRLPDDVGAAADGDVAVTGRLSRLGQRRFEVRDEPEAGLGRRLVRGAVGDHEQGPGERVGPAPRAGRVVHAAADHRGRYRRSELVVELLVGAVHREFVAALVGPRPAHHPVMQALAAPAQAILRTVVRPGDVTVNRRGDRCDDLAHGSSSVECRQDRLGRGPRLIASAREHSADQSLPGDGADDAVDGDRRDLLVQGLLEAADGGVGLWPEDPVDLQALIRVAGQVAELELLLDPADGVALAALLDRDDQRRPGGGADDAVDGQALLLLEGADGGVGGRAEDAVHSDVVAPGPEQVLQGLDGMMLGTLADERPWADRGSGHRFLLTRRGQRSCWRALLYP